MVGHERVVRRRVSLGRRLALLITVIRRSAQEDLSVRSHFIRCWVFLALFLFMSLWQGVVMADDDPPMHIVLLGASIGKSWRIDRIAERVSLPGRYQFEYAGVGAFDKSSLIDDVIKRPNKPAAVMIKECATYFPGDSAAYQRSVTEWVKILRAAGIQPILVTTAPLAEPTGFVQRVKDLIKGVIGKPTWQESVIEFNDWLKYYAKTEGLPVFDLEAALRRDDSKRWLRNEFDSGDGLHLNDVAYQAVDRAFVNFLAERR